MYLVSHLKRLGKFRFIIKADYAHLTISCSSYGSGINTPLIMHVTGGGSCTGADILRKALLVLRTPINI